ncbi:MAG: single-stranded DNA-binding protein [Bacteroidales bacterium]|jgi:single-strand DNA-binding protein|nr:single-stranded DNA-binding protein [Bacteroidales bacterium]
MNSLRNRVYLIGRLGSDPEIKQLNGGKTLARFSLATNENYTDADGKKVKETQWHNLVAWGTTAKTAEKYLKKGSEIAIEGKLIHRNYEDKGGNKRYVTEVQVNEFLMLGGKKEKE